MVPSLVLLFVGCGGGGGLVDDGLADVYETTVTWTEERDSADGAHTVATSWTAHLEVLRRTGSDNQWDATVGNVDGSITEYITTDPKLGSEICQTSQTGAASIAGTLVLAADGDSYTWQITSQGSTPAHTTCSFGGETTSEADVQLDFEVNAPHAACDVAGEPIPFDADDTVDSATWSWSTTCQDGDDTLTVNQSASFFGI